MNAPASKPVMKCPQCGATLPGGALAGLCPACLLKQGAGPDTAIQPEGRAFEPPALPELQRLFPQFEILALLGKGGMGAVYKARQPALERFVALKVFPAPPGSDPAFSERFSREARALARLSHPNIVALHEFGYVEGWHFFVMEFVDGVTLRQLQKTRRLSPREALQIIPQMCDALQYAHDEGVVHRDIKPENVLVDRKGRVKIADFGLARILGCEPQDLRLTREGQVMGTPHYMAPEQVEHPLEVDHRADIYSLGVVFYELLTGELPLGKFPPPSRKVEVDVRLDEVVLHALEKDPARRYQQANEVKTEVQTIVSSPGSATGAQVPVTTPAWATGIDFKSKARILGLPLIHVATGVDPATGKRRIATGIIAIGNVARGGIAIGGVAMGGIALGGLAIGFIPFGGLAIGLFALGGLAMGLLGAVGGGAMALVAIGGGALGYYAVGGGAVGAHTMSALGIDPQAWDFFQPWGRPVLRHGLAAALWIAGGVIVLAGLAPILLQRRKHDAIRNPIFWATGVVTLACATICFGLAASNRVFIDLPRLLLVSGRVTEKGTGIPLQRTRVVGTLGASEHNTIGYGSVEADGRFAMLVREPPEALVATAAGFETNRVKIEGRAFDYRRHARINLELERVRAASAETWSPALPDGEEPDREKVLDVGRSLMKSGEYEQALQRFIWYYEHMDGNTKMSPAIAVIYLASDWVELGKHYPKARTALLELRDRHTQKVLGDEGSFEKFQVLGTMNKYLGEDDATYQTFKKLEGLDEHLAKRCFPLVDRLLIAHGEYETCLKYLGDAESAFSFIKRVWEIGKQSEARQEENAKRIEEVQKRAGMNASIPVYHPPQLPKVADSQFVRQTCQLIEILLATNHKRDAENIRDQALEILPHDLLKSAIADAETRVASRTAKK